jgi:NADH-quinone oxidoreductase subunit E
MDSVHEEKIGEIIREYDSSRDSLISILQDVQSEYRYLPESILKLVARKLGLPLIQIYGVATFFKAFSLKPRGKHLLSVCLGTACHVRGAPAILDEVERKLCIEPGETSEDMQFTLETVNCLGACALGPIMVMDGEYHGQMVPGKVQATINRYKKSPKGRKK